MKQFMEKYPTLVGFGLGTLIGLILLYVATTPYINATNDIKNQKHLISDYLCETYKFECGLVYIYINENSPFLTIKAMEKETGKWVLGYYDPRTKRFIKDRS